MRRSLTTGVVLALLGLTGAGQAEGATTIGSDLSGDTNVGVICAGVCTWAQRGPLPGRQITAPTDGVIVKWRIKTGSSEPQPVRLRVVRGTGAASTGAGSSSPENVPATPGTYTFDTRLPIRAGDFIGIDCCAAGASYFSSRIGSSLDLWASPALADGETRAPAGTSADIELLVNADIEPDVDRDGFGDETQDRCPTDATKQAECDPPETTILRRPDNRTEKPKARFKFIADEAGSTFECSLKGRDLPRAVKQFGSCTSPKRYTDLDPGKYKFRVRATDPAGNTDPTAARDKFKILE